MWDVGMDACMGMGMAWIVVSSSHQGVAERDISIARDPDRTTRVVTLALISVLFPWSFPSFRRAGCTVVYASPSRRVANV